MFELLQPFIGSMMRHALSLVAGYLVAAKLLPAGQENGFVAACLLFVALGASFWHKLNQPGMLKDLAQRQAEKNVKRASVGSVFANSPNVIAALGICGLILAALASSANAQEDFTTRVIQPKKGGPKIIRIEPPMKVGLQSLIQQVSPVQVKGPDQLWANLSKVALADLQTALANANAASPSPATKARVACYTELLALLSRHTSASAATAGEAVGNGVFTKFEALAQLNEALQPGAPLQVACAPVAQIMRLQLLQFITTVTAGGLSLGTFGLVP